MGNHPSRSGVQFSGIPGLTTGTIIRGNTIDNEDADVVTNTPAEVDLHFNNLLGDQIGVDNLGSGTVNATNNYWGCFAGPGSSKCSSVSGARSDLRAIPQNPSPDSKAAEAVPRVSTNRARGL